MALACKVTQLIRGDPPACAASIGKPLGRGKRGWRPKAITCDLPIRPPPSSKGGPSGELDAEPAREVNVSSCGGVCWPQAAAIPRQASTWRPPGGGGGPPIRWTPINAPRADDLCGGVNVPIASNLHAPWPLMEGGPFPIHGFTATASRQVNHDVPGGLLPNLSSRRLA